MSALESAIRATGLDRHILRHDLHAAVHRYFLTFDDEELNLTRDQWLMWLMVSGAKPGDPFWVRVETALGEILGE